MPGNALRNCWGLAAASRPSMRSLYLPAQHTSPSRTKEVEVQVVHQPPGTISSNSDPKAACPRFPNLRRIRPDSRILRSSCPTNCPPEEIYALRGALGIRSLVDLRTADERYGDAVSADLWDQVVRVRKGQQQQEKTLDGGSSVTLFNVPLYTTTHIMRWVLLNAPVWEKPALLPGLVHIAGVSKPSPQALRTYNMSLSRHGLMGHNVFLLTKCGEQIAAVLQLMCDEANLPMLFFCSLGKDRTGVISMLALHCAGAERSEIKKDFAASWEGLKDIRERLHQKLTAGGLDPDEFLSARETLVDDVFGFLEAKYGSVDKYLDTIGFDSSWRKQLRDVV